VKIDIAIRLAGGEPKLRTAISIGRGQHLQADVAVGVRAGNFFHFLHCLRVVDVNHASIVIASGAAHDQNALRRDESANFGGRQERSLQPVVPTHGSTQRRGIDQTRKDIQSESTLRFDGAKHPPIALPRVVFECDCLELVIRILQVVVERDFKIRRDDLPLVILEINRVDLVLLLEHDRVIVKHEDVVVGACREIKQVLLLDPA